MYVRFNAKLHVGFRAIQRFVLVLKNSLKLKFDRFLEAANANQRVEMFRKADEL